MAAVIVRPEFTFDGKKLFNHVLNELPSYARPLFIRLQVHKNTDHRVTKSYKMWIQNVTETREGKKKNETFTGYRSRHGHGMLNIEQRLEGHSHLKG